MVEPVEATKTRFANQDGRPRASWLSKAVLVALLVPALGGCAAAAEDSGEESSEDEVTITVEEYGAWSSNDDHSAGNPAKAGFVPERFTIIPDDWEAKYVGSLADGRKYFLHASLYGDGLCTAIFYWNENGSYDSIEITPVKSQDSAGDAVVEKYASLGSPAIESISVAPFSEKYEGEEFGFVGAEGDLTIEGDSATVMLMPANNMVYYWPWDGEGYDT